MKRMQRVIWSVAVLAATVFGAEAADRYVLSDASDGRTGNIWVYHTPRGDFAEAVIRYADPPYDPALRVSGKLEAEEAADGTLTRNFVIGSAEYLGFQNAASYKKGAVYPISAAGENLADGATYEGEMGTLLGDAFTLGTPGLTVSFETYDSAAIVKSGILLPPPDGRYVLAETDSEKEMTADVAKVFLKAEIFWEESLQGTDRRYYDIVLTEVVSYAGLPEGEHRYYEITVTEPGAAEGTRYLVETFGRYIFRVNPDKSVTKLYDAMHPF